METTKNEIIDELTDILEKNIDAEKGYKKAAENTDHQGLKSYFQKKAEERSRFNAELKSELTSTYESLDIDGSIKGSLHRAWMDVKALFGSDDAESMLEESIKGDKAAIDEYNDVLEENEVPVNIRTMLIRQRNAIQEDINTNHSLESLH